MAESMQLERLKTVHPFPARMAPSIALDELTAMKRTGLRVLDPMAGSGTTLVVARSRGHEAFGFDTDPLARLISGVWCADINPEAVIKSAKTVHSAAKDVWRGIRQGEAYPAGADSETKVFVRYWFDAVNRRQLSALANSISVVRNAATRDVLWCAFSRLIIAKSRGASLAMDLSHSRPHRVLGRPPFRPLEHFLDAVAKVIANIPSFEGSLPPKASIRRADARVLPLDDATIDIVITSPPYLNAIDYIRCSKFSLVWMGHSIPSLRKLRGSNIGTQVMSKSNDAWLSSVAASAGDIDNLPRHDLKMLIQYVEDMDNVISEISRVLQNKGRCVFVIGDCAIRGVYVKNSEVLKTLGFHHGMKLKSVRVRQLPENRRYLPPPSSDQAGSSLQARMREEIVLSLTKH